LDIKDDESQDKKPGIDPEVIKKLKRGIGGFAFTVDKSFRNIFDRYGPSPRGLSDAIGNIQKKLIDPLQSMRVNPDAISRLQKNFSSLSDFSRPMLPKTSPMWLNDDSPNEDQDQEEQEDESVSPDVRAIPEQDDVHHYVGDSLLEGLINEGYNLEDKSVEFIEFTKIIRGNSNMLVQNGNRWGKLQWEGQVFQKTIQERYDQWFTEVESLMQHTTQDGEVMLKSAFEKIEFIIDQKESSYPGSVIDTGVPSSKDEAQSEIENAFGVILRFLQSLKNSSSSSMILIPDTNALIEVPELANYAKLVNGNDVTIIILPVVLSELDDLKIKSRDSEFREKVKSVISRLKGLRNQGDVRTGAKIHGNIRVKWVPIDPDFENTLPWLRESNHDDQIIASIKQIHWKYPSSNITLVTSDINLQNKSELARIKFAEPPD